MELQVHFEGREMIRISRISDASTVAAEICRRTVRLPSCPSGSHGLNPDDFYLLQNGKIIKDLTTSNDLQLCLRVLGGKGGFGSMLRAIGAQIEKTTNREACRDLSGRRLRDINEEKRLKAWLDKQKDKDAEAEEKRRKKLERLMAVPKHEFKDSQYEAARSELTEKVSEAVEEGFRKAAQKPKDPIAMKRKAAEQKGATKPKKAALWLDDGLGSSTDSDDSSEGDSESEGSAGSGSGGGESSKSCQSSSSDKAEVKATL